MYRTACCVISLLLCVAAAAQPSPPAQLPQSPGATGASRSETANISGVVLDFSGAAVGGAFVKLDGPPSLARTIQADSAGVFLFSGLPTGVYRITATAPNMGTYVSAELHLRAGKDIELSEISLAVGPTRADVSVISSPEEIAAEQVHEQEKQRVLGILPNFYSSYIWDAAPMNAKQKYGLAFHSILDPFSFVAAGIRAGIEQERNTYPGYGDDAAGYAKRFGSDFATQASSRLIGSAVLPSLLHQDPRYFYKGTGTKTSRALYAIRSAFVTRGDSGNLQPNYSYFIGAFASGALSYAYHPATDRSASIIYTNALIQIGTHAGDELIREFLLRRITPSVPDYKRGEPPPEEKHEEKH